MSLSISEVKSAIKAIVAKGQNPTQVKVREHLGKGSYTTINQTLREWRKENNQTIDLKPMESLEVLTSYQNGERDFSGVDLSEVILSNINLSFVDLSQSNLKSSILQNTNLRGADLSNSNLVKANLENADLTGADLRNVDLTDANLFLIIRVN